MRNPVRAAERTAALAAVVGSVLLMAGLLAGLANRNLVEARRFADHADAVRRDPAVASQLGVAITDQVLAAEPNLVAVRPLIEVTATALVRSSTFSPIVRTSAQQLHDAFTDEHSGPVVLRLVDVGAVIAGVLPSVAPQLADGLPADLDVTLAHLGGRTAGARTVHLLRVVSVLAWLLPLLAALAFAGGLWVAADRWRATVRTGWGVLVAGAGVGTVALVASVVAARADEDTLGGALVAAAWRQLGGAVWWVAAITVAAGGLLVAAATDRIPQLDLADPPRRALSWLVHRPDDRWHRIVRGGALLVLGAAAVLRPVVITAVLAVLGGLVLCLVGLGDLAAAAGGHRTPRPAARASASVWASRRWRPGLAMIAALAALVAVVTAGATPAAHQMSALSAAATCNGHAELCARRYDQVAFAATHNAMSAADEPGWFIPEQPTGLVGQLAAGVRVLLIDSWYGQPTQNRGVVATAPGSYAAALARARQLYGEEVVASALRVRDAVTPAPTGAVRPYLCHGLCEIGATEWEPVMAQVQAWLAAHPREVVTFFVQDEVSPADTASVFRRAGLLPYVYSREPGQPWPTLGQMIGSGRRVVVLMENHAGGAAYPWLLPGFDEVQDTPYTNPTAADLSCTRNRGTASSQLLLINYWLNNFRSLVTDARTINAYDVLWPHLARCRAERGMLPNYVAVNFYDQGDLFRVVDQLNGVPP